MDKSKLQQDYLALMDLEMMESIVGGQKKEKSVACAKTCSSTSQLCATMCQTCQTCQSRQFGNRLI